MPACTLRNDPETMTYSETIRNSAEIRAYLEGADRNFAAMGYTEQGVRHGGYTAGVAGDLLVALGYPPHEVERVRTAGLLHDIGCVVSYRDHARTGAALAYTLCGSLIADRKDLLAVVEMIGSHEDTTYGAYSPAASALIIADKTDVHRGRVLKTDMHQFDKYDRVHYAVTTSKLHTDQRARELHLDLVIDTGVCSVLEYFELFLGRVTFCQKAASVLGVRFTMTINGVRYL